MRHLTGFNLLIAYWALHLDSICSIGKVAYSLNMIVWQPLGNLCSLGEFLHLFFRGGKWSFTRVCQFKGHE